MSIFGNFAVPKGFGITKRLNDSGPKLLRNIYFYFYTIEFDSNELYKSHQFFGDFAIPKVLGMIAISKLDHKAWRNWFYYSTIVLTDDKNL